MPAEFTNEYAEFARFNCWPKKIIKSIYVNKDLQAYFEQIFCNSCTPLSILICILQTRVDFAVKHRGDSMEVKFDLFQRQKQMLQSLRAGEVAEKHGVVCLVCSILLVITVLKMSKLVCFSEFLCWRQRNVWSTEAIFYNAPERSLCALSGPDQLL